MRKITLIAFFIAGSYTSRAQVGYYFGDLLFNMIASWEEGGYEAKYTFFNDDPAWVHGLRGGWYVNDEQTFLIGTGFYGASTKINRKLTLLHQQSLFLMYGTLYADYTLFHERPFNLNPVLDIGYGGAYVNGGGANSAGLPTASGFFLIEPGLNGTLTVSRNFRIGIGAGYRFMGGVRLFGTDSFGLSGATINMFLKFGIFR